MLKLGKNILIVCVFFVSTLANAKGFKNATENFSLISGIKNRNLFFVDQLKNSWSWKSTLELGVAPYIYTPDKWKWEALAVVSLFAGRSIVSTKIQDYFQKKTPIGKTVEDAGNYFGSREFFLLYLGGYSAHAYWFKSKSSFNKTQFFLETYLATGLFVQIGKTISRQTRPDGSDKKSFPSGHAGRAFSLAAAVSFTHPWYFGVLANIAATGTALARMQSNKHYLHDVLASAVVSYSYAYALYKRNNLDPKKKNWLQPDSVFLGLNQLNVVWAF